MSTKLTPDMQGFYKNTIEGVSSMDYISYSKVSKYLDSPRAFKRRYLQGIKADDTPAKLFGRILHAALLEPESFMDKHIVAQKFSGTGSKAAKAEWLGSLNPDVQVITQEQSDKILFMLDSINEHPEAARLLKNSVRETKGYCYNDKIDTWFLFILDFMLNTKSGLIVGDLKTTADASQDAFGRDIFNYKYYVQAAIYIDLTERLLGKKVDKYPIIAVENVEPYVTEVYKLPPYLIEAGRQVYLKAVEKIKHDIKMTKKDDNYRWAGYTGSKSMVELDIPVWAYNKLINNEEYYSAG